MNTNSNSYTVIYASVMVVIVAFLLAFVSSSLKDTQEQNVELDKKKQILAALNVSTQGQDAAALYSQYIKEDAILDAKGEMVNSNGGFYVDVVYEYSIPLSERKLPMYIAQVEGQTKYIFPLQGSGLWGPIWGYVALNEDKNTIYGTYFSHAGETPGLGAEIVSRSFQQHFIGKHIMQNGQLVSVAVVKPGKAVQGQDYVDGISGGTITSVAVEKMLKDGLEQYNAYLTEK